MFERKTLKVQITLGVMIYLLRATIWWISYL